jgi:hypothetical protein
MTLRTERRYNDAVSILRGPLYYALRIGERYTELARHHDTLPVIDWQIEPTTPWNYGLILDPRDPGKTIEVVTRGIGKVPFDTKDAPVVLKVKGRQISEWGIVKNSAGETPRTPARSDEPITGLELVPYGSTRLRITEFPVIVE